MTIPPVDVLAQRLADMTPEQRAETGLSPEQLRRIFRHGRVRPPDDVRATYGTADTPNPRSP